MSLKEHEDEELSKDQNILGGLGQANEYGAVKSH